ncbi:MAG TPA: hypothetical protein VGF45_17580 [Polyangia bacterium]
MSSVVAFSSLRTNSYDFDQVFEETPHTPMFTATEAGDGVEPPIQSGIGSILRDTIIGALLEKAAEEIVEAVGEAVQEAGKKVEDLIETAAAATGAGAAHPPGSGPGFGPS